MRYLPIIGLIIFSSSVGLCQSIFTKDGERIGDRQELISSCNRVLNEEEMKMDGFVLDSYKICSCIYDSLIPTLYSYELVKVKGVEIGDIQIFFLSDANLKLIECCFIGNFTIKEEDFNYEKIEDTEIGREIAKFESGSISRIANMSWSENIHGNPSECTAWEKL